MRIWVTGPGIASPIYATSADPDNFINLAGPIPAVSIGNIPRGQYRVITAQFYDAARNPVAVAYAKAVYSSTDSGSVSLEVNRRSIPLAEVIEQILSNDPNLLNSLDLERLKSDLEAVMAWNGTSFTVDPSRFVASALATLIINAGRVPGDLQTILTPGSDYIKETASLSFNVTELLGDDKVIVRLADPTSPLITQGNGPVNITGILPGTWELSITTEGGIEYQGLFGSYNIDFTAGDAKTRTDVTVTYPAPNVSDFSITRGPRNSTLEITGENFHTQPDVNIVNFQQGANNYEATVLEAAFDRLLVRVPEVVDGGIYNVTVQVGINPRTDPVEFDVQKIWYIKPDGDAEALGDSWANATTLHRALADSAASDGLWLQQGTYLPGTGDRQASFVINKAVTLLGGFTGTESNANQRDPKNNLTILSGDQLQNDDPTDISLDHGSRQDNSYHVLTISDVPPPPMGVWDAPMVTLDGLVIEGGNANGEGSEPSPVDDEEGGGGDFGPPIPPRPCESDCPEPATGTQNQGGGLLAQSPVEIYNTHFRRNSAVYGGGILYAGVSDFEVHDSRFSHNYADENGGAINTLGIAKLQRNHFEHNQAWNGGAVMASSEAWEGGHSIEHNIFAHNRALNNGGGLNGQAAHTNFCYNVFFNNSAGYVGGGLFYSVGSRLDYYDNLFAQNQAYRGGGAFIEGTDPSRTHEDDNNSYILNTAEDSGSGLYWAAAQKLQLKNTLLLGNNIIRGVDAEVLLINSATDLPDLATLIQDAWQGFSGSIVDQGELSLFDLDDPQLQDIDNPIGPDGIWKTDDDGLIPLLSSPLVGAGVYRGSTWYIDIRNRLRLSATPESPDYQGFSEDPTIGAYEHNGKPVSSNSF